MFKNSGTNWIYCFFRKRWLTLLMLLRMLIYLLEVSQCTPKWSKEVTQGIASLGEVAVTYESLASWKNKNFCSLCMLGQMCHLEAGFSCCKARKVAFSARRVRAREAREPLDAKNLWERHFLGSVIQNTRGNGHESGTWTQWPLSSCDNFGFNSSATCIYSLGSVQVKSHRRCNVREELSFSVKSFICLLELISAGSNSFSDLIYFPLSSEMTKYRHFMSNISDVIIHYILSSLYERVMRSSISSLLTQTCKCLTAWVYLNSCCHFIELGLQEFCKYA